MKLYVVLLIILAVLIAVLVVLYFLGKRLQRKQAASQEQMEATKQVTSLLVIDKKMMRIKDSGLPQIVIDQTPKLMRRSKLPIVKAKVGPKIMTLVADSKIFDQIPVKKEVKAVVSGIYIMEVRGIRGPLETVEKKKGIFAQAKAKAAALTGRNKDSAKKDAPEKMEKGQSRRERKEAAEAAEKASAAAAGNAKASAAADAGNTAEARNNASSGSEPANDSVKRAPARVAMGSKPTSSKSKKGNKKKHK